MTQELQRDNSLPYQEFIVRPGEILDFGIEWATWLANRWFAGVPFVAASVIRPRKSTGFEYLSAAGGMTGAPTPGSIEPAWPTQIAGSLIDGAVSWVCQAISNASLQSTISSSAWAGDNPLTTAGQTLVGQRTAIIATIPANAPDGDYYLRNTITLANTLKKVGTFLLKVRAGKV